MFKKISCVMVALLILVQTAYASDNSVSAKAAIVMEAGTGRVLFAQNEHERLPFASTTKIMTALLALEQPEIDAEFVVDSGAIRVEGSSMGLVEGDTVTLRTLAVGMLLPSGNDAANAAAVQIAGSIPAFAEKMNSRAAEIGMTNTSFETPSGLDGEHHYSTAYDLALLARVALQNADFMEICSSQRMKVNFGNPPHDRWLSNSNRLLSRYEHTNGMKTGFTRRSGRCLVSTALKDNVQLIVVTLHAHGDWNIHERLYEQYFGELKAVDVAENIPDISIPIAGGVLGGITPVFTENMTVTIPIDSVYELEYSIVVPPFLYAPVKSEQVVGLIGVWLDGEHIADIDLIAGQDVELLHPYEPERESFWRRILRVFER